MYKKDVCNHFLLLMAYTHLSKSHPEEVRPTADENLIVINLSDGDPVKSSNCDESLV